jgi:hypothetical protein
MGQSVHLGNFDECIGVENVQSDSGSFRGQHCLVAFHETPTHDLYDVPDIRVYEEYDYDVWDNNRKVSTLSEKETLSMYLKLQDIFITEHMSANFVTYFQV